MGNDGKIDCRLCGERHRPGPTCPKFMVKAAPAATKAPAINKEPEQASAPAPPSMANSMANDVDNGMGNGPARMDNSMDNKRKGKVAAGPPVDGNPSYKYRDADKRREYVRVKMRELRARQRAAKGAAK